MGLLPRLLVPGICGAEISDDGQPVTLHPEEEALMAHAAPKRCRDFALGRGCAHAALAELGQDAAVIAIGERGVPSWPPGILGSITHTQGYAAAIVGEAKYFAGLGVDAERVGGVPQDLWPRLFGSAERDYLLSLDDAGQSVAATLFFSAKETCFKAWQLKGGLPFVEMHVVAEEGGLVVARAGERLGVRYAVEGDLVLTTAWF